MSEVNNLVGFAGPVDSRPYGGRTTFTTPGLPAGARVECPIEMTGDSSFGTGAVRSADANELRFDLIHPVALIALARTYAEGATKYGSRNYERGMPVHDLLNHALRHIIMYLAGDRTEPHLPHATWGLMTAIVSDALWPGLNAKHLRGPGCTLTAEGLKHQEDGDAGRRAKRAAGEFDNLGEWNAKDIPEVKRILEQRGGAGDEG